MNEWEWQLLEERPELNGVLVNGVELRQGDSIRLRPRAGGDVLDLALAGKTAVIESIERDYEDKIYFAVVVEDDPGRDLGMLRQPGHRFFFSPEEVEPLPLNAECGARNPIEEGDMRIEEVQLEEMQLAPNPQSAIPNPKAARILIAGIGNIFLGDDAFGSEVARRLLSHKLPDEVRVIDFGIRGFDLVYALLEDYDATIFIDATPRGEAPGTLYTIEPDLNDLDSLHNECSSVETHGMNPVKVLSLVKSMGGDLGRILLIGCEPSPLESEAGQMGLSEPVQQAVNEAINMVESLVAGILATDGRFAQAIVRKRRGKENQRGEYCHET